MNDRKVWLITGCSTGLGRALAIFVAEQGHKVVATVRKEHQIEELESFAPENIKGILMDVRFNDQIEEGVQSTIDEFGRIDVLVNNAGYGSIGPVESVDPEEVKRQFEVNVYGPIHLCKVALPHMRKVGSGHIINISSIAGLRGTPGLGIYNASKFALEGLGEALALELKDAGIQVTNIEPGPFRTKWAGASATFADEIAEEYKNTAGKFMSNLNSYNGQQPGSPEKAAAAIFEITELDNPPVHLPLGEVAYQGAYKKIDSLKKEIESFEHIGRPTDYD